MAKMSLEEIYRLHNTDTPHDDESMQCQCADCKKYRASLKAAADKAATK